MKKILMATAVIALMGAPALAKDGHRPQPPAPEPVSSNYKFEGPANIGSIEQGNGINAAILTQGAAMKGAVEFQSDSLFKNLESMNNLGEARFMNVTDSDIGDVCYMAGCEEFDTEFEIDTVRIPIDLVDGQLEGVQP
jgi:hypothetical protein